MSLDHSLQMLTTSSSLKFCKQVNSNLSLHGTNNTVDSSSSLMLDSSVWIMKQQFCIEYISSERGSVYLCTDPGMSPMTLQHFLFAKRESIKASPDMMNNSPKKQGAL